MPIETAADAQNWPALIYLLEKHSRESEFLFRQDKLRFNPQIWPELEAWNKLPAWFKARNLYAAYYAIIPRLEQGASLMSTIELPRWLQSHNKWELYFIYLSEFENRTKYQQLYHKVS